jgi:hypothetical protein
MFFFIRLLLHNACHCLECVNKVMVSRVGRESTCMHLSISQNTFPIVSSFWAHCSSLCLLWVVMWCDFLQYSLVSDLNCYLLLAVSVWHIPVAVCTVLNSWWWTERLSETCRVLYQINKFEKLVHLVGCTIECTAYKYIRVYDARTYERQKNLNNSGSATMDWSGRKMDCQRIIWLSHWTVANRHGKSIVGWAEIHNIFYTCIYQQMLDPEHVNHDVGGVAGLWIVLNPAVIQLMVQELFQEYKLLFSKTVQ